MLLGQCPRCPPVGMRRGGVFAGGGSLRERERSARRPGSVRVGTAEGVSREEAVGGEVSEMGAWLVGEWEELLSCEMGAEDVKREWEGPMHDWALGPPLSRPVAGNVVVTLGDGRTLSLGGDNADRAKLLRRGGWGLCGVVWVKVVQAMIDLVPCAHINT